MIEAARIAAIDRCMASAIGRGAAVGLTIGVGRAGECLWSQGYGLADAERGIAATPASVFRIGSVTKQFVAAAVMLLAERGALDPDAALAAYLPQFPHADRMTLRQLLAHSAGLANFTESPDFPALTARERTAEEMLAFIAAMEPVLVFAPGTAWRYSNSGYVLIGAVIEAVTGQSATAFIEQEILLPLGLTQTAFDTSGAEVAHRAEGYIPDPVAAARFRTAEHQPMSVAGCAGAMRSTVGDLIAWHGTLQDGRIIRQSSAAAMIAVARLSDGRPVSAQVIGSPEVPAEPLPEYGLGLRRFSAGAHSGFGHGGSIPGFNAVLATFDDAHATTIAVLANADGAAYAVADAVFAAIL